jgi:major vault protein
MFMPDYNGYDNPQTMRQKDLVLSPNELVFVQSKTNGVIKTYTGPVMLTISQQEAMVVFDPKTKQFKETGDFEKAKQLFVSPPENWYAVLKNPAHGNIHPEAGKAVTSPELQIGKKINIAGPCSFSLFPGQMAKVIQGHRLRSNQYLLARVYDAEEAQKNSGVLVDANGKEKSDNQKYFSGQLLIIKGTEVSFYIPPTGVEVIPINNDPREGYVRDAVTLERLEYAILKDENGTKEYTHGPKVVFPKPTETFVTSPKGGYIFRALELSPISGIYVKVIAEYKDNEGTPDEVVHPIGEEMFITGKDQMIYYPRPEHSIITYDGKTMHHAIAIPKGEGRYIMDRLTGEIKTVLGPTMYLPDPRTEVVVKRKLTDSQCALWYPGNSDVLNYNRGLNEKAVEKATAKGLTTDAMAYATLTSCSTLANFESNAAISRGTSYTKPRTITLDTKYEGVVSMDVWTGFAVKITSKSGKSRVVCGPQTVLLDYDETLEVLSLSTGRPKNTDRLDKTVFLRHENNKISDLIEVETKDFVKARVKISYSVNFEKDAIDRWFNVDNYVKYLCDRERVMIKNAVKNYNIDEFYQNYITIIHNAALDANREMGDGDKAGYYFQENGMRVHDCEVLVFEVDPDIEQILTDHQEDMIVKTLRLADAERAFEVAQKLAETEAAEAELKHKNELYMLDLQRQAAEVKDAATAATNRRKEAEATAQAEAKVAMEQAAANAKRDVQVILDEIKAAELAREKEETQMKLDFKKEQEKLIAERQRVYAETVKEVMGSIGPDLVAALTSKSNNDMLVAVSQAIAPYALAGDDESTADVVNKLLRGTPLEDIVGGVNLNV